MEENVEGFSKEKTSKIKFHVVAIICIILFYSIYLSCYNI